MTAHIRIPCDTELLEISRRALRKPEATDAQIEAAREALAVSRDWNDIVLLEQLARAPKRTAKPAAQITPKPIWTHWQTLGLILSGLIVAICAIILEGAL